MIILPATIENISTRKDRTVKVVIGTQELAPEKAGQLMGMQNVLAYVAIKKEAFTQEDEQLLEKLKAAEVNGKTPSQRLRNTLYVYWQQNPEGFQTSNQHYDFYMEKFIDHVKSKLDP